MSATAKEQMIRMDLEARGIDAPAVLRAMRTVAREAFLPKSLKACAYDDCPLPLMQGQTISQPYIVAAMTQMLQLRQGARALEIGSGSGYQAAVLAQIAAEVHSVERIPELAEVARTNLSAAGVDNVQVHLGDGWNGWPMAAPYDGILVTAASERIPEPLIEQLSPEGRLIIPVGKAGGVQDLMELYKNPDGEIRQTKRMAVRFVPFISSHA
jgi:protein-L-isoaspartate(D-aspartate) O-methyltransferase